MKKNLEIKFVLSLIFAILVAIFAIQNAVAVEINFLFARFTISQALIILISAIVGAIVVLLISLMNQISQRKKNRELKKEVHRLNEEIEAMQNPKDDLNQDSQLLNKHVHLEKDNYESGENSLKNESDEFESQLNEYLSDGENNDNKGDNKEDGIK